MRRWIILTMLAGTVLALAGAACSNKSSGGTKIVATNSKPSQTSVVVPSPTSAVQPEGNLSVPQWAAALCATAQTLSDNLTSLNDGIDPSTLTVDQRKTRALRFDLATVAAFSNAKDALSALNPPAEVSSYNSTLIKTWGDLVDALRADQDAIPRAQTAADIEALNAQNNIVATQAETKAKQAGAQLSANAVAALQGVTHCGDIFTAP